MIKPQYLIRNERESGLQKEKNHEIKINDHQLTEGKMLMEHRIYVLTMDRTLMLSVLFMRHKKES